MPIRTAALLILGLAVITTAFGQESRGTISGRVADSTGSAMARASVLVVNTQTRTQFHAETNEAGLFTIPYLLPGNYDVTVEQKGFKKLVRQGIELQVNDNISLDLQMVLGDVS